MADRKQTPDILSEILAGAPSSQPLPAKTLTPKKRTPAGDRPVSKPAEPAKKKKTQFEYEVLSFQEHRGWRCRFINGKEVADWMAAPLLHETIQQRAGDGWELVAATSGEPLYALSDKRQLFFRRERES